MPIGPLNRQNLVNDAHPLNRGRVAWWLALPWRAGGATWHDVGGRYPGTLAATGVAWRASAHPGGWCSLLFDGTASTAPVATALLGPDLPLTHRAWFRADTLAAFKAVVGHADIAGQMLISSNATDLTYMWDAAGDDYNGASGLTVTAGRWLYGAITITPAAATVYLGDPTAGTLKSWTNARAHTTQVPTVLQIGSERGGNKWVGAIDDASTWMRALSAAEVRADYDQGLRGYPGVLNRVGLPAWAGSVGGGPTGVTFRRTAHIRTGSRGVS